MFEWEQPSRCSAHTIPHPQCQRCYASINTGTSIGRDDQAISATCRWHTASAPHPRCPDCNSLNPSSSNATPGPIDHGCQVHTTPNPRCVRCNGAPFTEVLSSSVAARTCPWHAIAAPHPRCPQCRPQSRTNGTANLVPCQVHTNPSPLCERGTGIPFAERIPGSRPVTPALRRCSLHAQLNAPHPTCDQCNRPATPSAPTNHVDALGGFDARSFALVSCNVHSRRAAGCGACYTAARREQILMGIPQVDAMNPHGRGNDHQQHITTNDTARLVNYDSMPTDIPPASANNASRTDVLQSSSTIPLRCNRHTTDAPNPHCQTCNEAFLHDLTAPPSPSTEPTHPSPDRRRCNRHDPNAPNPNCQSCINVYTAQRRRERVAASDDPDDAPPPAYNAAQSDRVIALGLPHPTLRVPSYTSARAPSTEILRTEESGVLRTTEPPPPPPPPPPPFEGLDSQRSDVARWD